MLKVMCIISVSPDRFVSNMGYIKERILTQRQVPQLTFWKNRIILKVRMKSVHQKIDFCSLK